MLAKGVAALAVSLHKAQHRLWAGNWPRQALPHRAAPRPRTPFAARPTCAAPNSRSCAWVNWPRHDRWFQNRHAHSYHPSIPPRGGRERRPGSRVGPALVAAGHDVHLLIVDREQPVGSEELPVRRVACRAGDPAANLAFDVPYFESETRGQQTFAGLSADQLARYRRSCARELDAEVDGFDPDVIHVEHVWVLGQLVLETGVPYVSRAWGPELASCRMRRELHALAQQAAEKRGGSSCPMRRWPRGVADARCCRRADLFWHRAEHPATAYSGIYRTVLKSVWRYGRVKDKRKFQDCR